MSEVTWGVPAQRTKKTEKYNTPVITLSAIAKKGAGRKFSFNKAAQELLTLEKGKSEISFGFKDTNVFIGNTTGRDVANHKITKTYSFSDAKAYNYIVKLLGLDETIENELHFDGDAGAEFYTVSGVTNENPTENYDSGIDAVMAPGQEGVLLTEPLPEEVIGAELITEEEDSTTEQW